MIIDFYDVDLKGLRDNLCSSRVETGFSSKRRKKAVEAREKIIKESRHHF